MVVNNMVQLPEQQWWKKFVGEVSSLPDGSEITQSMAEVLHQVENGNVAEGGWVRADAWFGSMSSIGLTTRFSVCSTFVIKTIHIYFQRSPSLQ